MLDLEDVDTPGNVVELDVDSSDLEVLVDLEEVEALDWVAVDADTTECPVPENLVVTGDEDVVGVNDWDWVLGDTVVPLVTADSCRSTDAKL